MEAASSIKPEKSVSGDDQAPLRILHVITSMDRGGAERQLLLLAQSQVQDGMDVGVLFFEGEGALRGNLDDAGVRVFSRPMSGWKLGRDLSILVGGAISLRGVMAQFKPDLVHAHLPHAELVCSLALAPRFPTVHTRHVTPPLLAKHRILSRIISRFALRKRPRVVAISHAVARNLRSTLEIPRNCDVRVIHYGKRWAPGNADRVQGIRQPIGAPLVLGSVGRLVPQKGFDLLIRALAEPAIRDRDWELRIAGSGPEVANLLKLSSHLQVEDRVSFVGETDEPEHFMSTLDVFVFPSRFEGFGLVLLEAMAVGVPIVASDSTAIPEVVVAGESALLFQSGEHQRLADVLTRMWDPDERRRLAEAATKRLSSLFTIDRVVSEHRQVYYQALADTRRV